MDSIIEVQRQTHEEIERFERALYTLLSQPLPTHESQLRNAHSAAQVLSRIDARVAGLNNLYLNEEARQAEFDVLGGVRGDGGAPAPGNDDGLGEFYKRLNRIQEHHAKYPDSAMSTGFEMELEALLEEVNEAGEEYDDYYGEEDPISLLFSGEESYGKYLDLYANHSAYSNLKNIGKRPGYLQYLDLLISAQDGPVHRELAREVRLSKDYELYINALYAYILSFVKRTQPLTDVDGQQTEAESAFDAKWEAGEIAGWEEATRDVETNGNGATGIWCSACQKSYSKQTVYDAHLTSKKHLKATSKQATTAPPPPNPNGTPRTDSLSAPTPHTTAKLRARASAHRTYLVTALLASLVTTLNDTKSNVERRFSLTAREREQELLEQSKKASHTPANKDVTGGAGEEEEEEERIYNPLKLPLGWDGKPIPYWLYKLHGLGVEYRCEICSDHVYMGRKNFDRHFQESRHAFGMRALGLPNTKHFHEITRIEDALSLAEKLKQEGRHEIFEQETMEELEDDEGNVYNRKTYEDLKKQGLI